jgi:polyisoprenoid-binding protein YceI
MKLSAVLVSLAMVLVIAFVAMPTPASPTPANVLEAVTFSVDKVHSSVVFKVRHNGVANFYGRFNDFSGTFAFDPDDLATANFDVTVDVGSIDTGNANRDGHLKNADFFSADSHGEITFKSTGVSMGAKEGNYALKGDLTMLGETRPITANLEWFGTNESPRGGTIGGFEAIFTIKRSEFGMDYGVSAGALGDEVTLFVSLEGRKQS